MPAGGACETGLQSARLCRLELGGRNTFSVREKKEKGVGVKDNNAFREGGCAYQFGFAFSTRFVPHAVELLPALVFFLARVASCTGYAVRLCE